MTSFRLLMVHLLLLRHLPFDDCPHGFDEISSQVVVMGKQQILLQNSILRLSVRLQNALTDLSVGLNGQPPL
jgi:hypothetical protein